MEENEQGIFDSILRGHLDFLSEPWPSISSSAKDLVRKMLRQDPKERLSALDALSKFLFEICYPKHEYHNQEPLRSSLSSDQSKTGKGKR